MKAIRLSLLVTVVLTACASATTAPPPAPAPTAVPPAETTKLLPEEPAPFDTSEWRTDFKRHTVPFDEILSGGPPKDGIPAIDEPTFIAPGAASDWLKDNEPVILFENQDDVRAYPLQILIWHEIVNDTVAGLPVAITFCPLCNSSIVFDRTVAGAPTTFGTTGKLHYSDLVMYDRASESWWQQMTGQAIVGDRVGTALAFLPSQVISFGDFKVRFPDGKILSRETGYTRSYGVNPYARYDAPDNIPFLYQGPATPSKLRPVDRVVTLALGDRAMAYPYPVLAEKRVVNDTVAGQAIVVFWKGGTASALDTRAMAAGRDIGTTGVFSRNANGRTLTFVADGDKIRDSETGTQWDILGYGIQGPLAGRRLQPIVHGDYFWFAWAAFRPDSQVYGIK
ncbi:MAG: DUF3179 domain-containing protein [Chloroflexi bacterium]|nr:DUF3179 domain-containing protein [Chloroflexota bacterium]